MIVELSIDIQGTKYYKYNNIIYHIDSGICGHKYWYNKDGLYMTFIHSKAQYNKYCKRIMKLKVLW